MSNSHQDKFSLERFMLSANLSEFSQRVAYICCLLDHDEMTSEEAEREIEELYQQLKKSAVNLGVRQS